ncbi:TIGR03767 family metallophosphoesterase [Streptomyces sp. NPDC058872]|uniref:TIGR03767 family metallophosphoesterase n=1 Tax=Streptomyces sp. NPDC058872 TaxID=3346661 RepID=UPI0036B9DE39
MSGLTRRELIALGGLVGAGVALGGTAARAAPLVAGAGRAISVDGTTLQAVATPVTAGTDSYTRLASGPGWPLVVREDLATGQASRDDRRMAVTAFAQLTDLHVLDAESPARFEYVHPLIPSAHRPQEALAPMATIALVERINALRGGPFTGRRLDAVVTTGDNTDNHELLELDWFLALLNGGKFTPTSGDLTRFEGVQTSGSSHYWNPGRATAGAWTDKGFPTIPGLLEAAGKTVTSPGLALPWFCTFGNHDDSVAGTLADMPGTEEWYTGRWKVIGRDEGDMRRIARALREPGAVLSVKDLTSGGIVREVTPDQRRRPFTPGEFVRAHLDAPGRSGPAGHGFTENNADGQDVYYSFRLAPGITGISLDTTTTALADGSIGQRQLRWLERQLRQNSSVYWTDDGTRVRQAVSDELFVLFSHHTSTTMGNLLPDRRHPLDPRLPGAALVALLHRYPNVVAWVNGHTHANKITPHAGDRPELGFWEINTASHIDFPQLARLIEVADNGDGTLSLFTTLIEADAPYAAGYGDFSAPGLASLYRELSYNDLYVNLQQLGETADRNTELLLANPLA